LRSAPRLYTAIALARKTQRIASMSIGFIVAACMFALVLGCAVACIDRWREARLVMPRLKAAAPMAREVKPVRPAPQRRAA